MENIISSSESISNSCVLNNIGDNNSNFGHTDTIEVEFKDSSKTYNINRLHLSRRTKIKEVQAKYNKLKNEIKRSGVELESSRKIFIAVTDKLKQQLDIAKDRESKSQTETLGLRLENEKLHVLLESKQNLVDRLKMELLNVKRALRIAIKDIYNVSRVPEALADGHEEYASPRSPRRPRSPRVRFADSLCDAGDAPLRA